MTHVVLAPDKFKGSLPAAEVATHLAVGLRIAHPQLKVIPIPVADGGEGTVAAAMSAGYEPVEVTVRGPTGQPVRATFARRGDSAVVELASASGLGQLPAGLVEPLHASSWGTGELVSAALDAGCRLIVLGLGGSASTDGGAGLVRGLGGRLFDATGNELPDGGAALLDLARIDLSSLHPGLAEAELVIACDVDNPLLGSQGAAAVYGPQKGATPQQVGLLDRALAVWATAVAQTVGRDLADHPGAGTAGGVGFGAMAVLGARPRPGIDTIMELTGLRRHLSDALLVVTGEGRLDEQTLRGKAAAGVAQAATQAGVPVVAVCGQSLLSMTETDALGLAGVYAMTDLEPDKQRCIDTPGPLLERLAGQIAIDHLKNGSSR